MKIKYLGRIIVTLFLLFLLHGMWAAIQLHGTVSLGNDYRYYRAESGVVIDCVPASGDCNRRLQIVAQRAEDRHTDFWGLPKVGPSVDGYRVYGNAIIGHVAKARERNSFGDLIPVETHKRPEGYFIIDVKQDELYDGLAKHAWLSKLQKFGITCEPKLFQPSIYDKLLRRNKNAGRG